MFMKKRETVENEKQQKLYTKENVLKSKRFLKYRDVFSVKLNKDKLYTMKELEEIEKTVKENRKE